MFALEGIYGSGGYNRGVNGRVLKAVVDYDSSELWKDDLASQAALTEKKRLGSRSNPAENILYSTMRYQHPGLKQHICDLYGKDRFVRVLDHLDVAGEEQHYHIDDTWEPVDKQQEWKWPDHWTLRCPTNKMVHAALFRWLRQRLYALLYVKHQASR